MPSRTEIKPLVIQKLQVVTEEDQRATVESSDLEIDLGMPAYAKKGMALAYTKISRRYLGGRPVSATEAGECKKVKDAIDLVHTRANGKA